jgi:hypothetical protein
VRLRWGRGDDDERTHLVIIDYLTCACVCACVSLLTATNHDDAAALVTHLAGAGPKPAEDARRALPARHNNLMLSIRLRRPNSRPTDWPAHNWRALLACAVRQLAPPAGRPIAISCGGVQPICGHGRRRRADSPTRPAAALFVVGVISNMVK